MDPEEDHLKVDPDLEDHLKDLNLSIDLQEVLDLDPMDPSMTISTTLEVRRGEVEEDGVEVVEAEEVLMGHHQEVPCLGEMMDLLWAVDPHSDPEEAQMTENGIANNLHGMIEAEEVAEEETAAVVASIDVVTAEVLAVSTTEIMTAVTMEVLAPATAEVLVPETAEGSAIMADSVIVIVTVTIVTTVTDEIVVENEIAVGIGIADRPNAKDDPDGAAKQSLENRNLPDILKKFKI